VSIDVTAVNDGPVANNDSFTTPEDTRVSGNVRDNDVDPDGDALTVNGSPVICPQSGELLSLDSDGGFSYEPFPDFAGTDSFVYR